VIELARWTPLRLFPYTRNFAQSQKLRICPPYSAVEVDTDSLLIRALGSSAPAKEELSKSERSKCSSGHLTFVEAASFLIPSISKHKRKHAKVRQASAS
jgi:hypothetical protein